MKKNTNDKGELIHEMTSIHFWRIKINALLIMTHDSNLFLLTAGSTVLGGSDPSAETLISWLLDHPDLNLDDDTDTDSISSLDFYSDSESTSEDFEAEEAADFFGNNNVVSLMLIYILFFNKKNLVFWHTLIAIY